MVHREPSWKSRTKMSRHFRETPQLYKLSGKRQWIANWFKKTNAAISYDVKILGSATKQIITLVMLVGF